MLSIKSQSPSASASNSAIKAEIFLEPAFNIAARKEALPLILEQAKSIQDRFEDVVIIGTGGSSLGAKMLNALSRSDAPTLHFLENADDNSVNRLLNKLKLDDTLFLVISKSGGTLETMSIFAMVAAKLGADRLKKQCIAISDAKESALRNLAKKYDFPVLEHPKEIGGRFSVFTIVGLLPAAIAGVDVKVLLNAAESYLEKPSITEEMLAWHQQQWKDGKTISVVMPYADQLDYYTYWWRQLWAESLGKAGNYSTPFAAVGSVDQHSQLQQWLDGPKDKSFVVITADHETETTINSAYVAMDAHPYIANKSLAHISRALAEGTIKSLQDAKLPLTHIQLSALDEVTFGELIAHHMLEVVAMASVLGVNAYDQPAVESGKMISKEILESL